jgi:Arylsulfotransferase (ASST)/Secretion system C-terminal sorting domain/Cep192 domain 4
MNHTYTTLPQFLFIIFFSILFFNPDLIGQQTHISSYQYISPVPGSIMNQPEETIIIRQGDLINPASLNPEYIKVTGNKSGNHQGSLILSDDGKTIIFKPLVPFSLGEIVQVSINEGITTINGKLLKSTPFQFRIRNNEVDKKKYNPSTTFLSEIMKGRKESVNRNEKHISKTQNDSLPADFPYISLETNNHPYPGEVFAAPFVFHPNPEYGYLMITDIDAVPIFYRRFDYPAYDFKLQKNGQLTYFAHFKFYELNDSYSLVDSFSAGNGYSTDIHELNILPNGHALLIAIDYEYVRMDTIVAGGDSTAIVEGAIIQELDLDKNVVFEWRSWDHYKITDATPDIDLMASIIDYVHCNAIEEDADSNIIISCRHMDEITKINRQTGDIIWRCGGEYCKNNQFTFINDSTGFSHQHDIRRLPNGNLTLFDNGNLHSPPYSRACEYQMDEVNNIITLVWQYKNDPVTYTFAMGKVQRLANHNTFIGWGANNAPPSISEVTPYGSIAWFASFPDTVINYRAFKFNWRTNYFVTDPDTIFFNEVHVGQSDTAGFVVTNNSDSTLTINGVYSSDTSFSLVQAPPFQIAAHTNISLAVKFEPTTDGYFRGWIHLQSNHYYERIAQVIFVHGRTDTAFTSIGNKEIVNEFRLYQNYPNPFNPTTTITYSIPFDGNVKLNVYDILGREVTKLVNGEKHQGKYSIVFNASGLSSGVYFYRIEVVSKNINNKNNYTAVKKLLLLK